MTIEQAVEIAVAMTGHPTWRTLCGDDYPDVEARDAYRTLVLGMAGAPVAGKAPEAPPPLPEDLALRAYVVRHGCCG